MSGLRLAARSLAKTPLFSVVAAGTLALGIGAATSMFSVLSAVILRPLPYPESGRIVRIYTEFPTLGLHDFWMSAPEFFDLEADAKAFSAVGAWTEGGVNVGADDGPVRARAAQFTEGMLPVLGISPAKGRNFTTEEDRRGGPNVALVSDPFWRRALGGREDLVGREIVVQGEKVEVVGILPATFYFPPGASSPPDVVFPLALDRSAEARKRRGSHYLHVLGRLAPGTTLSGAEAEKSRLVAAWAASLGTTHVFGEKHPLLYRAAREDVTRGVRSAVWTLFAAVGLVLLISCVNVANLLLARGEAKRREIALRVALGAGRGTLARHFFAEGLVISLAAAAAGSLLAWATLRLLVALHPEALPRAAEIALDGRVLAFAVALAFATAAVFSVAPLAAVRDLDLGRDLQSGGLRNSGNLRGRRLRRALVALEVAMTVVLLVGAGLMLRTFRQLQRADAGFDPRGVLTFEIELPAATYGKSEDRAAFWSRLEERLRAIPGVTAATTLDGAPPVRELLANDTDIDGYTAPPEGPYENVDYYQTTGRELQEVLDVRVEEGRGFELSDERPGAPPVVLVNRALARKFWQGKSALGGRLRPEGVEVPWFTVVGILPDLRNGGMDRPAGPEVFFLEAQAGRAGFASTELTVAVRTPGDPLALTRAVRETVRGLDPSLPVARVRTLEEIVDGSLERTRLISRLMTAFSVVAVLLAAVGIYGVTAYTVSRRTREIGVRIALGARPVDVISMILLGGLALAGVGLACGIAGSLALSRYVGSLLHGVSPTDPTTFVAVAALVGFLAGAASWLPARRAARVDPAEALRVE